MLLSANAYLVNKSFHEVYFIKGCRRNPFSRTNLDILHFHLQSWLLSTLAIIFLNNNYNYLQIIVLIPDLCLIDGLYIKYFTIHITIFMIYYEDIKYYPHLIENLFRNIILTVFCFLSFILFCTSLDSVVFSMGFREKVFNHKLW